MRAKVYTAEEITDFSKARPDLTAEKTVVQITATEPELVMVKPGKLVKKLDEIEVISFGDTLEEPVSLTMRGYLYQIPLHRFGPDIIADRHERERDRINRVKRRGRKSETSPDWTDATTERLAHAADSDLDADANELPSPSGFATNQKYRKIDSPFDWALKKGWIRERHWMAGARFWKFMHGAGASSRLIADLHQSGGGCRSSLPSDYRMHCQDELNGALASLPLKYRDPFFTWAYAGLSEDLSVMSLGVAFSRAKHPPALLAKAKKIMAEILEILAKHWGL